ncbi:5-formyltetrahydrofolate cyclo-ligase [Quillaja saponaria]|uniref:5-formyltetrahydrofolate cyclo-ligase n=1 Tax=Quillaja saponaria TaxID=32244 RepID=A0AAD7P5Z3_QUISA|nr:5-formyltetrahydrofolate cyclo-ligase [Quillaja saponaria]
MLRHCRTTRGQQIVINTAKVVFMTQPFTLASPPLSQCVLFPRSSNLRQLSDTGGSSETMNSDYNSQLEKIFEEKRSLRSKLRAELKKMDPIRRTQEDNAIQSIVLQAPWFKSSKSICAYVSCDSLREVDTSRIMSEILSKPATEGNVQIKRKLYVPRVEDRNSNMRMLNISSLNDLITNSMNILEPALLDCNGNPREDVMQASEPVNLIILPGLGFDKSGRRLGRSGGYYDMFLKKYQELVKKQNWKQPFLVALSYSLQIVDDGILAVTPYDVPVDALVTPSGFIPISSIALENCQ